MTTTSDPHPFGPSWYGWESYGQFEQSVKSHLRYVRSRGASNFLDEVPASCANRKLIIPKKRIYWRARVGCKYETITDVNPDITVVYDEERPYSATEMKPIPKWEIEGRANPRGIPHLYLATTRDTALAEVRPWIGATISVAQFEVRRDLNVIDCSKHHSIKGISDIFSDHTRPREDGIWIAIDRAFATPISRNDESKDYIPTQIIAELFKSTGYDGIVFKSLLSVDGFNLALFNLNDADVVHCALFKAASINFDFKETGSEYWVKDPGGPAIAIK